jgi:hypothetical protein
MNRDEHKEKMNVLIGNILTVTNQRLNSPEFRSLYKDGKLAFDGGHSKGEVVGYIKSEVLYDTKKKEYELVKSLYDLHNKQLDLVKTLKFCAEKDFDSFFDNFFYNTRCSDAVIKSVDNMALDISLLKDLINFEEEVLPVMEAYQANQTMSSMGRVHNGFILGDFDSSYTE